MEKKRSVFGRLAALALGDYCVTEAGFGADLGAEKFLDIKCRMAGLAPDAAVVVATVRALKLHGGATGDLSRENPEALKRGLPTLRRHVENLQQVYGLPVVVALNEFATDTPAETALVREMCRSIGAETVCSRVWEQGSAGGVELAEKRGSVLWNIDKAAPSRFSHENPEVHELYREFMKKPLSDVSHHLLHTDHQAWKMPSQK